jgi:RNA polymerase sigma-70 factor (ECF subfamily)
MIGHTEQIGLGGTGLAAEQETGFCEEAFAALVTRQSQFVYRVAYAVLRNSHDAEDVVQDVFLKLYRSSQWEGMKDERAYLSRVAWRLSIDRLKMRDGGNVDSLRAGPPSSGQTPEQLVLQANWSAVVHQLIDALPESLRLPLVLSAADDLKSADIAELLKIPEGTVRRRTLEARAILKQKLSALMESRHAT